MRILLDAYFDNNFGDDLFIDILLKRYPNDKFYVFWKSASECVLQGVEKYPNLIVFPGQCVYQEKINFDAYILIGGDVLPNGMNYEERICWMQHVRSCGGYVAMLGFSLYKEYGSQTIQDLKIMTGLADTIVTRDRESAQRLKELIPEVSVTESTDMVFAALEKSDVMQSDILGIVPRRKLYSTEIEYDNYCRSMAEVADAYLEKKPSWRVRFLAFSTGEYDDRETAKHIISFMKKQGGVEQKSYENDIAGFYREIAECRVLLPTRFHGTVISVLQGIPFIPVAYEVKVTQFLEELGYAGICIEYGEKVSGKKLAQIVSEIGNSNINEEKRKDYFSKKKRFFEDTDNWKRTREEALETIVFDEKQCNMKLENERLVRENNALTLQVKELEKWIELLKQQKEQVEEQNLELENLRMDMAKRLAQIDEEGKGSEQVRELEKWVASLKAEREKFEKHNMMLEEIRQWQYEQLMSRIVARGKFEAKYRELLKELEEKYK